MSIHPGLASLESVPDTLTLSTAFTGRSLADEGMIDSFLAYDLDGSRTVERIERVHRLVRLNEIEKERLRYLSELVSLHLMDLADYRSSRGRGYTDQLFARVNETRSMLRWHLDIRRWGDPTLDRYRLAINELFQVLGRGA